MPRMLPWPLPWPLPALLAWLLAWGGWAVLSRLGAPASTRWVLGCALGLALAAAWPGLGRWRRLLLALGFPASAVGLGLAQALPAWAWLLPLALLLGAYPLRAWRDAPLFPTPVDALHGLARLAALAPGAPVLDAGCGLGQGLSALRAEYPDARVSGVEWSPLLAWVARRRCRWAEVRRGDLWADDWGGYDLVYLFQRPESMARAWAKACSDMAPGSWLVSLDFAVPDVAPTHSVQGPRAPSVWLYRVPDGSTPGAPRRYPQHTGDGPQRRSGQPVPRNR
jgi:hypothetical protein